MYNVLLIWDEIPSRQNIYSVRVNEETFNRMSKCHGLYLNSDDLTADEDKNLIWLASLIEESEFKNNIIFNSDKCEANPIFHTSEAVYVIVSGVIC